MTQPTPIHAAKLRSLPILTADMQFSLYPVEVVAAG